MKLAQQIESHLNSELADLSEGTVGQFDYYEIASHLQVDKAKVKRILFPNGGGSNGITIRR